MTEARYVTHSSGAVDIVNFIPTEEGLVRVFPTINAVVTQVVETFDEAGKPVYTPVTSILCHDKHMESVLIDHARQMMGSKPSP